MNRRMGFRRNPLLFLALASVFLVTCGLPAAPASLPFQASRSTPTAGPTPQPNPLTVQVKLDNQISASAVISETGGTLGVNAADGTKFTLTIPANALLYEQKITLTPVNAIEGLPLSGGLQAAVQLEPDGLQLFEAATLTIELPKPITSDGLKSIGFMYHGDGQEFHLYPSRVEGSKITFLLSHFSGGGSGKGTKADVAKQQQQHPPSSPQDRLNQDLADAEKSLARQLLKTAYLSLERKLDAAQSNPGLLEEAIGEYNSWVHAVIEAGLQNEFRAEQQIALGLLANAVVNAANRAYEDCVNKNDPAKIIEMEKWLTYARHRLLRPFVGADRLKDLEEKLRKCATFELTFDSTMSYGIEDSLVFRFEFPSHVRAKLVIPFSFAPNSSEFQTPLEHVSFAPTIKVKIPEPGFTCAYDTAKAGSATFKARSPWLRFPGGGVPPQVSLFIDPGGPAIPAQMSATCRTSDGAVSNVLDFSETMYSRAWQYFHKDEYPGVDFYFLISKWERGEGKVFARKTYSHPRTEPCGSAGTFGGVSASTDCSETTTLELIHKPQK